MNIPNLPTDNLYKFIALTGVIIFIITIFYPEYQRTSIRDEIILYNRELQKLNIEKDKSKRKLRGIKMQVETLDKKSNCNCSSIINDTIIVRTRVTEGSKELVELSNQIDKLIEDYISTNIELDIKGVEIVAKLDLINSKNEDLTTLTEATYFFGPFSMVLALFGFLLWYDNTQKYQDRVLKEQANQYLKTDFCQSCGMRLSDQTHHHLFSNEDKQSIYCKTCFNVGEFTEPELTLEQMKRKVRNRCKELGFSKLLTLVVTIRLKNLERWKEKFIWK